MNAGLRLGTMDLLEKYLKQPPPDTTIWRYIDLPKFLSLIHTRELFFPPFKFLDDSYEGSMRWMLSESFIESFSKFTQDQYTYIRKYSFVSCWHANDYESAAMWKLYLSNNQGIAIKTTVGKLTNSLSWDKYRPYIFQPKMGLVIYRNDRIVAEQGTDDWASDDLSLFCKRLSFEHEREYRVVFKTTEGIREMIKEGGLSIPIDPETLIEEVYVAPTAPAWIKPLLQSILETKYELNILVHQSSLDEKTLW